MKKRLFLLGILLGFFLMASAESRAYVRIKTTGGIPIKWPQMPVTWYYNHNGFTQLTSQQMVSVVSTGFSAWGAPACSAVKAQYNGTTTAQWNQNDRQNVIIWNSQIPSAQYPQALALTIPNANAQGILLDADIIFNTSYQWSLNPTGQQFDVLGTVTHELGHLLGLDHTNVPSATMYPTAAPGLCPCRTLKQDDIDGICAIYPSGNGGNGGNGGGQKRQLGQPCDRNNLCDTGLMCVITAQGATTGICLSLCQAGGVCPNGETCKKLTNGAQVCACLNDQECSGGKKCANFQCTGGGGQGGNGQQLGDPCDNQRRCAPGLLCLSAKNATVGTCFSACQTQGTKCPTGETCVSVGNGYFACLCGKDADCQAGQTCTNYRCSQGGNGGGPNKEGAPCTASCSGGLHCVTNPYNRSQTICLRPCQTNQDCPTQGTVCNQKEKYCLPNLVKKRGEVCTANELCLPGLTCTIVQQGAQSGICFPNCSAQQPCSGGEKCVPLSGMNRSVCVCQKDADCSNSRLCKNYRCIQGSTGCQNDAQCPPGQSCQAGQCQPSSSGCQNDSQCPTGQTCQNGKCTTPPSGACINDTQCPAGQTCQNGHCRAGAPTCTSNAQCPNGEICQNGRCVANPSGGCTNDAQCGQGQKCEGGACVPSSQGQSTCQPPCGQGYICQNGQCVMREFCGTDAECPPHYECQNSRCIVKTTNRQKTPKKGCQCNTTPSSELPILPLFLILCLFFLPRRRKKS